MRLPSTWGLSVAERRDLMVAVYSSLLGTGEALTVTVWTGNALMAGAAGAADLLQPATDARHNTGSIQKLFECGAKELFLKP